jgi:hypothetical protein
MKDRLESNINLTTCSCDAFERLTTVAGPDDTPKVMDMERLTGALVKSMTREST